jgi:hypothetical protein
LPTAYKTDRPGSAKTAGPLNLTVPLKLIAEAGFTGAEAASINGGLAARLFD